MQDVVLYYSEGMVYGWGGLRLPWLTLSGAARQVVGMGFNEVSSNGVTNVPIGHGNPLEDIKRLSQ